MTLHDWQKSSFCGQGEGCLNITKDEDGNIKIWEETDPDGVIVTTTPEKLKAFILGVKAGEFDHFGVEQPGAGTAAQ